MFTRIPKRSLPKLRHIDLVQAIYEDQYGVIWVGTSSGLNRLDLATGDFTSFTQKGVNILSIFEDRASALWIGSRSGLLMFDRATETFVDAPPDNADSLGDVHAITEDVNNVLWFGTSNGLYRYERRDVIAAAVASGPDTPPERLLGSVRTYFVYEDPEEGLWLGSHSGLARYFPDTGERRSYDAYIGIEHSLSNDTVYCVYEDALATLWFGTADGLNRYDPEADRQAMIFDRASGPPGIQYRAMLEAGFPDGPFSKYGQEHGIPGKAVYGILGDDAFSDRHRR